MKEEVFKFCVLIARGKAFTPSLIPVLPSFPFARVRCARTHH